MRRHHYGNEKWAELERQEEEWKKRNQSEHDMAH